MRPKTILFITSLGLILILAFIWIGKEIVIEPKGYKSDFYWIWYGARAVINQQNPYGVETTNGIQVFFGGKPIELGQYSHPFPFPAYLAVVFLPFALLPYPAALLLWIGIQFPLLFTALYLMKNYLDLDIQGLKLFPYLFAGSIGFFYPVLSYALGQLGILMFFLFALAFYLLKIKHPGWAGVTLAFIAIRPDFFLVACAACLTILWKERYPIKRLALSTGASLIAMNLVTIFLLGMWYPDWINTVSYYSSDNPFVHWPPDTLLENSGTKIALVLTLVAYLTWQVLQLRTLPTQRNKLSVISALIIVYLTLTKMTGSYYMTLLLIPLLILLCFYSQHKFSWIIWIMFFSPWIAWLSVPSVYAWSDQLLIPLSLFVLQVTYLYATRNRSFVPPMEALQ